MPADNFQPVFAAAVEAGWKVQTIRAKRKNRPRVGQTAHCFTRLRTRQCRRLGAWTIEDVTDVRLDYAGVMLDGSPLRANDLDAFAWADGFKDWEDMRTWFRATHGLPFHGDLVMWHADTHASANARNQGLAPQGETHE